MQDESTNPVVMEALEWFVRMRDDKASAEDRRAFEAWLEQDSSHAAALTRAEALWRRFDIVTPELDRLRRSQSALNRRNLILGGAVALIGAGSVYLRSRDDLFPDYATDVGERRTVSLGDGSSVELGSYSALSVDFTAALRQVRLHRGQGFFEVTNDPMRPFTVDAAGTTVQALGTRFDVKYMNDLVTVVVSEHAVMVRGAFAAMKVEQGWQVSFTRNKAGALTQADLVITEAWRRDQIIFQDVPLRRVLAEIGRYRRGRIVLIDGGLGDTPVTAIFSSKQPDNALQALADTLAIRIFQAGPLLTVVYSA
jgi:transmembrane sensor